MRAMQQTRHALFKVVKLESVTSRAHRFPKNTFLASQAFSTSSKLQHLSWRTPILTRTADTSSTASFSTSATPGASTPSSAIPEGPASTSNSSTSSSSSNVASNENISASPISKPSLLKRLFNGVVLLLSTAGVCLSLSCSAFYAYKLLFYVPNAVTSTFESIKEDHWLVEELGSPVRMASRWHGYVRDEEARVSFDVKGSRLDRSGTLFADLIKTADGQDWDTISIRFARTDDEAIAAGIAPDPEGSADVFFTSNNGPGTKTTAIPFDPSIGMTDDLMAASQGFSVPTIFNVPTPSVPTPAPNRSVPVAQAGGPAVCPFNLPSPGSPSAPK